MTPARLLYTSPLHLIIICVMEAYHVATPGVRRNNYIVTGGTVRFLRAVSVIIYIIIFRR